MNKDTSNSVQQRLVTALEDLLKYADMNTCRHEETHRGGTIWTICDQCGQKWADDEGGMPAFEEPQALKSARKILEEVCGVGADSQEHKTMGAFKRLMALRGRLHACIKIAISEDDADYKSNEGAFSAHAPNYFGEPWAVELYCYVIGPSRHYRWEGTTLEEAVALCEKEVGDWCAAYESEEESVSDE